MIKQVVLYLPACPSRWLVVASPREKRLRDSVIHHDVRPGLLDAWRRVLEAGQPKQAKARFRRFAGDDRWYLIRMVPIRDESSALLGWYGTNTDIDDLKQAQMKLRQDEKELRQMTDATSRAPGRLAKVRHMANRMSRQSPPRCFGINHLALAQALLFAGAEDHDARLRFGAPRCLMKLAGVEAAGAHPCQLPRVRAQLVRGGAGRCMKKQQATKTRTGFVRCPADHRTGVRLSGGVYVTGKAGGIKNVVLVHGGFVDGSGWQGVYDMLKKDGYTVSIVQNPTISLADDVAVTKRTLAAQDGPAILVGHSYGGVVITEAGNDPKVAGLVYIAAFAPDKGESVSALIKNPPPGAPVPPILPPQDGFLLLDRTKFRASFAADVSADAAAFMADSQVPWGLDALNGAVTEPAWKTKPSWYLVSTEDKMIPPDAQRAMSKRAGSTVVEAKGSHAVYVSQPRAVADLIAKAANGVALATR